jgi:hypothetical protein
LTRFSQLYIDRGKPTGDSERLRNRLAAEAEAGDISEYAASIVREINRQIACNIVDYGSKRIALGKFFRQGAMRDVLDAITVTFGTLLRADLSSLAKAWLRNCAICLVEENVAYRVGPDGIVHPFVDQEFEANRAASLAALADPKLAEARSEFEAAHRHLRDGENKQAIRSMFASAETTLKVLYPGKIDRLEVKELNNHVRPRLLSMYTDNEPAIMASNRLLEGFGKWIVASHQYRHGQEVRPIRRGRRPLSILALDLPVCVA